MTRKAFHEKCDNKGPTVSLFKTHDDQEIGGFTAASWKSESGKQTDENAFLFNLSKQFLFPVVDPEYALYKFSDEGPCFGDCEISTYYWPFNGQI